MDNGQKIKIHEDVASLKTDMDYVKKQVSNHIPTSIKEIKDDIKDLRTMFGGMERKLAYWSGAIAVVVIIAQLLINKIL